MKNRKLLKSFALVLLVISLAVIGLSLTSCNDEKITDIYIANVNAPRTLYVEGQDLDLSVGYLTVVMKNGEEAKLAFTSDEVSVSGYNKDQLGEQTVTFHYGDLTTTLTVTVIPRMVAEGYETLYFVGDAFNKEKGTFKIAADSGTTFTVNMSDSRVKVESFDSSKTGVVAVTVSYNDGTSVYRTTFNVTVYEHENVTFTAPPEKNNSYVSHDKNGVNVSGGYFTVVSTDGKLTKMVNLTADMVSGFDLTAATMANRTEPYIQTLTVEYLPGITFTYDIKITYSPVSVVNYYAERVLSDIVWPTEGDLASALNEDQFTAALDALDAYYKLTTAEKKLVNAENTKAIVLAGTVAAQKAFNQELEGFGGTFAIDEKFNIYLTAEDFDTVAADIVRLKNKNEKINLYAKYLQNLKADFANTEITADKTVGEHIRVYTKEMYDIIVGIVEHMVSVYEGLAEFPENWTNETLAGYGEAILGAALQIKGAGYYQNGEGGFYTEVLSKWRKNDDFFDILYAYFLYEYEGGIDFISGNMLGAVPLPRELDAWHESLTQAVLYIEYYIEYYNSYLKTGKMEYLQEIIIDDISPMMFYFFETLELAENIKDTNKQLYLDLYRAIEGDSINHIYMYNRDFGYLYLVGGLDDAAAFNELWKNYYAVLKLYDKKELSADAHSAELKSLFESFSELSPTELFGFLNTINFLYAKTDFSVRVLSYTDTSSYSTFVRILKENYLNYLDDANKPLFAKLLVAMESYALVGHKDGALAEFVKLMGEIVNAYNNTLTAEEKANFDSYLGTAYAQYLDLYLLSLEGAAMPTLTAQESALLAELLASLERYYALHSYMGTLTEKPNTLFGILYATFAEADSLYKEFMSIASREAKAYLFFKTYNVGGREQTLALSMYEVDETTTAMLNGRSFELTSSDNYVYRATAWELLGDFDMLPLLADLASLLYYGYNAEAVNIGTDEVITLMERVRNLQGIQYSIFAMLYQENAYYTALEKFLQDNLSEDGDAIAEKLILAEQAFRANDTTAFEAAMQAATAAWAELENVQDKNLLASFYEFYQAKLA